MNYSDPEDCKRRVREILDFQAERRARLIRAIGETVIIGLLIYAGVHASMRISVLEGQVKTLQVQVETMKTVKATMHIDKIEIPVTIKRGLDGFDAVVK